MEDDSMLTDDKPKYISASRQCTCLVDLHFSFFCSRNQHSYIVTDASIVNTCKLARHKSRTLANVSEGSLS